MPNDENIAANVMSGSQLCNPRPGKRARICSKQTRREEERTVQTKIDELRAQYQKTKMVDGIFAYFWYDPNHHYFIQNSQLTPEHALNWPADTGYQSWKPLPANGITQAMEWEMKTWGRLLMYKNTDVFGGTTGVDSPWLQVINGANPPTIGPFQQPPEDRKSMSNYMVVKINSAPYFIEPPSGFIDIAPVCPLNNEILGTHTPVVDCMVVATRPQASPDSDCIPCDSAPGEILYPPEPLGSSQFRQVEIPICMLWGLMPRVPTLPRPPWILTQTLGRMARSAVPGTLGGPPPLWGNINEAGAWPAPFRQLVEAGESGDYADPVVGCCYDDMDTNCSSHQGNKDQCIAQPNCTWNSETSQCLQGVFGDSCANVECPRGSTRVAFSEHINKTPGEECCRPIRSCTGMDYSTCISNYHCNWDQEDERPRCRTRECTKADCGGEAVTTSVSGTAPNCKCECKAPAVGKNYCYVADSPVAPNTTNCLRRLSDRCRDRLPRNQLDIEQLNDCIACVEGDDDQATVDADHAAGCTNNIRGLFCNKLTCSGYSSSRCPEGQTLKADLDTTLQSDVGGCCTASCAAARCPWGEKLKPNPETIPRSQGCCIVKTCEDETCPPNYRLKANPETISITDGCCEPIVRSYSNKRILSDCDQMHHMAIGSNQQETCSTAASFQNGEWYNCKWDDNVAFFNDCDYNYESGNLGTVELLPVGPLPGEDARPTGKHVWYQGLSSDYNVVDSCDDNCEPNPYGSGGDICSDGCRNKIDKYGRVCAYQSGGGASFCLPRLWNIGDSNAENMNDYTGGILSTPN